MLNSQLPFIPALLDDAGLTPDAFRVYCNLVRRQGRSEAAYPSLDGISATCQMCRKRAMRAIRGLLGRGAILRVPRAGETSLYEAVEPQKWRTTEAQETPRGATRTTTQSVLHPEGVVRFTPHKGYPYKGNPIKGNTPPYPRMW